MTKTLVATPDPESNDGSPFDSIRRTHEDGTEYWLARELTPLLGYTKWERVPAVIGRAAASARNSGFDPEDHFRPSSQMVSIGSKASREIDDYELTRYGAYLVAMNGDPRKPKVAAAQTYFAVRTREAEVRAERPMSELELAYRYIAVLEREQQLAAANADLTEKVAELSPKAEGYDDLIAADGYLDMGAVAKALSPATGGMGRTRFLNLLRGMGIIMQASTLPYQNLIDRGYFAVRTEVTVSGAHPYAVVTPKGLRWLHAELREDRPTLDHGGAKELPAGSEDAAAA